MTKYLFSMLCIFAFSSLSYTQEISGFIFDSLTLKPLPQTQILLVDYHQGTYTDDNGFYTFSGNYPSKVQMKISVLGYETKLLTWIQTLNNQTVYLLPQHLEIEEITASGTKNQLQKYEVTHIETRSLKDLNVIPSGSLGEAIAQIPGVYNASTGLGVSKPVIRGFQGTRVLTLLNGMRIENQQWGGDHGMGLTELGIGSVEVIKGPASLLYGADALGGVLYFTDEGYAQQNSLDVKLTSQYISNTAGSINSLFLKGANSKVKVNAGLRYSSQADYQLPNGSFVSNSNFNDLSGKLNIGWSKGKWISSVKYSFAQAKIGIIGESEDSIVTAESFTGSNQVRNTELPFQQFTNHFVSFENKFIFKKHMLEVLLGFTSNQLQEFEDTLAIPAMQLNLYNLPYTIKMHSELSEKWSLNYGIQGMSQFQHNLADAEERLIPDAQQFDNGLFVTALYRLKNWRFQAGARMDVRAIQSFADTSTFLSPFKKTYTGSNYSLGGVYNKNKQTIRLNVSTGFRVPHLSELLSDGVHHGALRYEIGNVNLKTERATQVDFTYEHNGDHLSLILNPFASAISNYTTLQSLDTIIADFPAYQYQQVSTAFLYGTDAGVHYHPHFAHFLHVESSVSLIRGVTAGNENLNFIPQPRWNNSFIFRFNMKSNFKVTEFVTSFNYNFQQKFNAPLETKSIDYSLLNFGLNMKWDSIKFPMELQLGVRNALNNNYIDHLSRLKTIGISNPGRTFYAKLILNLNVKKK